MSETFERRSFIIKAAAACLSTGAVLAASGCKPAAPPVEDNGSGEEQLPPSSPDPENPFGIDLNINMSNVDEYLNRSDVAYRDLRMLVNPDATGDLENAFGIEDVLEGFRIVPFPFIAKLPGEPVAGKYAGETLISLEFDEEDNIISHRFNYEEAPLVLDDLFPKDKAIFLVCRLGDHSGLMRKLLIHLGWQESLIYNVGGMWAYEGSKFLEVTVYPTQVGGHKIFASWRADYAVIDFELLHHLEV